VTRFRLHSALAVAGLIAFISSFSLASVGGFFLLVPIVPLIVTIWAWRAGTDADANGLRVRALFGSREIPWTHVTALAPDQRGRVIAALTDGRSVPLTAVRAEDLPRLMAASGKTVAAQ
jgi:hypothetical protein